MASFVSQLTVCSFYSGLVYTGDEELDLADDDVPELAYGACYACCYGVEMRPFGVPNPDPSIPPLDVCLVG